MTNEWQRAARVSHRDQERYFQLMFFVRQALSNIEEEWEYGRIEKRCEPPIEIRSGAIVETYPGGYAIDANTMKGLRRFHAREVSLGDPQSEDRDYRRLAQSTIFFEWTITAKTVAYSPAALSLESPCEELPAELEEEPQITAADVLSNLENHSLSRDDLRKFILEAEVVSFNAEQANQLKPLLRRHIEHNRDSSDPADLVAVGSAIRKYVGILGRDEISSVGFVLEAGHKTPVSPELELEVTKMIVRKLSAVAPQEANSLAELGNQLMDLARTYLNPRLLPRQYHGAIALNSVLALTLLRVPNLAELFDRVRQLPLPWFKQLVVRRAEALKQDLAKRFAGNEANACLESLDALVHAIQQAP